MEITTVTTPRSPRTTAPTRRAEASQARLREGTHRETTPTPLAPKGDTVTAGPTPDTQLHQFRQLGRNFRARNPEREKHQTLVEEATRPRPEAPEAAQVRQDFRQTWDRAQAYWDEGRRLAAAGPGSRTRPDGRQDEVRSLPNGGTEVSTRNPDGSNRSIRYDDTGRVYVQNRGPDGQLRDSLYRSNAYVATNPFPDYAETGKPSQVHNVFPDGSIIGSRQTGLKDWKGFQVAPDGTLKPFDSPPHEGDPSGPRADSEIPGLRDSVPYTGKGVTIGLLDDYDQFRGKMGPHSTQVAEVAAGAENGVAPGAQAIPYSRVSAGDMPPSPRTFPDLSDDPAALDRALRGPSDQLDQYTNRAAEILADPNRDPKMRAFNISAGGSKSAYYGRLEATLEERNEQGDYRYPNLRREVYGDVTLTEDQQKERVVAYADPRLNHPQSGYQQSLQQWQDVTRRYEEAGIAMVVAATNTKPGTGWDQFSPGSMFNDLGRSPHVIAVGASDTRGVPGPGHRGQHAPWENSTAGDGPSGYNPTLLAPGKDVMTTGDTFGSGTSFATPFVCGTIALMAEANPNLSVADIRRILQSSTTTLEGVDPRVQGAGVLNPEEAVRQAGAGLR